MFRGAIPILYFSIISSLRSHVESANSFIMDFFIPSIWYSALLSIFRKFNVLLPLYIFTGIFKQQKNRLQKPAPIFFVELMVGIEPTTCALREQFFTFYIF